MKSAKELQEKALKAYKEGDNAKASQLFHEIINQFPDSKEALDAAGQIRIMMHKG